MLSSGIRLDSGLQFFFAAQSRLKLHADAEIKIELRCLRSPNNKNRLVAITKLVYLKLKTLRSPDAFMLTHLTLINFALADHLAIDIEQGFNVLTGEKIGRASCRERVSSPV